MGGGADSQYRWCRKGLGLTERGNGEQAQPATQVTYQAKHAVATTEAATWQTTMPGTGDMSDLLGETFVIGGTVLVAAGVFLSDKRRQLTR